MQKVSIRENYKRREQRQQGRARKLWVSVLTLVRSKLNHNISDTYRRNNTIPFLGTYVKKNSAAPKQTNKQTMLQMEAPNGAVDLHANERQGSILA